MFATAEDRDLLPGDTCGDSQRHTTSWQGRDGVLGSVEACVAGNAAGGCAKHSELISNAVSGCSLDARRAFYRCAVRARSRYRCRQRDNAVKRCDALVLSESSLWLNSLAPSESATPRRARAICWRAYPRELSSRSGLASLTRRRGRPCGRAKPLRGAGAA